MFKKKNRIRYFTWLRMVTITLLNLFSKIFFLVLNVMTILIALFFFLKKYRRNVALLSEKWNTLALSSWNSSSIGIGLIWKSFLSSCWYWVLFWSLLFSLRFLSWLRLLSRRFSVLLDRDLLRWFLWRRSWCLLCLWSLWKIDDLTHLNNKIEILIFFRENRLCFCCDFDHALFLVHN